MENDSPKAKTWNIRKEQRFEAKKRKVEALLNLFENDKCVPSKPKKLAGEDSLSESHKALKNELKKFVKKPEIEPCIYLTETGLKALTDVKKKNNRVKDFSKSIPLCVEDVYHFLLRSMIGHLSPHPLQWAKLEQPQNICRTVMLVVSGLPIKEMLKNIASLTCVRENFSCIVKVISQNIPFATELSTVHLITDFHIQSQDAYSTLFPEEKDVKLLPLHNEKNITRLHLLLSPIQLVMENYPLPQSVFQYSKSSNYVFSKNEYAPVTADSPIFAIDCEMCRTENGQNELTRVAVVNENLEIIYHSYVKPKARIVDFLTRFSGITKKTLKDVKTQLCDVQSQLQELLPPDAILCGQSLNCDLHALKMIHPYVIDTSNNFVIFLLMFYNITHSPITFGSFHVESTGLCHPHIPNLTTKNCEREMSL